jgi:Excinuclease ATPase subunit
MAFMKYYKCPVCGFPYLEEEPYINGGEAGSFDICPCCGFQFGYNPKKSIPEYRKQWMLNGAKWFSEDDKPEDWSLEDQLKNIGVQIMDR